MQIFVRIEGGRTIAIEVSPMDTIDNIKTKIRDKEGLSTESFFLEYGNREVEEGRTLTDYDIKNESTLYLKKIVQSSYVESHHHVLSGSSSGRGVKLTRKEAMRYSACAMVVGVAIVLLFLWMSDYAFYGLFAVLIAILCALYFLREAMTCEGASDLLR